MTLIEALKQVPDHRRGQGQRYPLWIFLLLIILGTMSGYHSLRALERFMLRHQGHLAPRLGLKRDHLPSYSTIRRLLLAIDYHAVAQAFNQWSQQAHMAPPGMQCAVDGKSLKNTLTHPFDAHQNFINIVSVFCLEQGIVIGQQVFENGEQSEIAVVHQLLEQLQLQQVTFSLDALHAQKKRSN